MRQLKISQQITNRDSASIEKYLNEVSKEEMITPDEEIELARQIREGQQIALEKLVKANLRFVISVAKQYQGKGLSLSDLISEGNVGLIKAAKRFDETRGFKFISYAVWWIRQSIIQAISEQSRMVRLPQNKVTDTRKIAEAASSLEQKFEREPTAEELARIIGKSKTEVNYTRNISKFHISMDAPFAEGEDHSLLNVLENTENPPPDSILIRESLRKELEIAMSQQLTKQEAEVVNLYFGIGRKEPCSLEDIGERLNVSRERVRQIKEKAIRRLRQGLHSKVLRSYLN